VPTNFYRRETLPVGVKIQGPAIVLQMDSTTVVPPGWSFMADAGGNLLLRQGDPA
jgi:N-methylhydantoinase A/oxoprolinase/acetone carboxylase beta subunit